MIKLTIDSKECLAKEGSTILEAAKDNGIDIPTLCYLKDVNEEGACRMCLVQVEGLRNFVTACTTKVSENMVVRTNTKELIDARKINLELILSNHNKSCLTCIRNTNCELQSLARKFNIRDLEYEGEKTEPIYDDSSLCIVRDTSKCILCGRCVNICSKIQTVSAITKTDRGFKTRIGVATDSGIVNTTCVGCGQCVVNCPVGALSEKDYIQEVEEALGNKDMHVVVQVAPSIRAAIGEEFGLKVGTLVTGKLVSSLKKLGFDKVFDTDMAADLTIMEEGTEFLERLEKNENLPMITSCSSGWITFAEKFYGDLLPLLSTAKSPMEMMGTIIKTKYAENEKIDPKTIFSVAIMPCSAKKAEIVREELKINGIQMVDVVLTTRELARMLKKYNIDLANQEEQNFDSPYSIATGAAHIFGRTGGVMEAALRELSLELNKKPLEKLKFKPLLKRPGVKETKVVLGGKEYNIAVADGLGNVRYLLDKIKSGENKYMFIEAMTCNGGCIMGGGQPIVPQNKMSRNMLKLFRTSALCKADDDSKYKVSSENKDVMRLYKEYYKKPNSEIAHKYLHTKYKKQEVYK